MYRINVKGECPFSLEQLRENAELAVNSGLPFVSQQEPHGRPLAVVGGGRSGDLALSELKQWPGDIWAINGTCNHLAQRGVKSTFFTVDADPVIADIGFAAKEALIASSCHPSVIEARQGKRTTFFHCHFIEGDGFRVGGGTTSATRTPMLALHLGYREISFFGCEGSYSDETHTFKDELAIRPGQIYVRAGGVDYRSDLPLLDQCESLSAYIAEYPQFFKDRSGGLLGAMIAYPDTWEVVALDQDLKQKLDPEENPEPFTPRAA